MPHLKRNHHTQAFIPGRPAIAASKHADVLNFPSFTSTMTLPTEATLDLLHPAFRRGPPLPHIPPQEQCREVPTGDIMTALNVTEVKAPFATHLPFMVSISLRTRPGIREPSYAEHTAQQVSLVKKRCLAQVMTSLFPFVVFNLSLQALRHGTSE